tara:strand:- start:445 stop:1374 length:930 start_codon:yes stop_codon:yes gene_type:complete
MKNLLKTFNPTFNNYKMKNKKSLMKNLLFALTFLGTVSFSQNQVNADESPVCPDASSTTITSIADRGDATSFYALTSGGFCKGTPDEYGVTVYKMGFCTKNPGNPTGSSVLAGSVPDYSTCSWTYENSSGEAANFSSGGSIDLSDAYASDPAVGTYGYAVMLISKDFLIKGKFGPVGGKTYYSTSTFEVSSNNISDYDTTTAPLNSFGGSGSCDAYTEDEVVTGGTISAYLVNSSGTMLESDSSLSKCFGQEKLLGVMNMSSDLIISDSTTGLKMTFVVTNNGMSVISNREGTDIHMDSGPFSVSFETF